MRTDLSTNKTSLLILWFLMFTFQSVQSSHEASGRSTEGFYLTGPTHCFSVGAGYDSKFLFSIRSLGYRGRVDFNTVVPGEVTVELRSPIFLNSTDGGTYCPVTVRATSAASTGEQSIVITARGGSYSDAISICIIVSDFTRLTIQTSPLEVPTVIFFDNTKYNIEGKPLTLQTRVGKHTLEAYTSESRIGTRQFMRKGLILSSLDGNSTQYMSQERLLTFTINGNSTLTILFEEATQNEAERTSWKESLIARNLVPIALALIIVSAVILLYVRIRITRRNSRKNEDEMI